MRKNWTDTVLESTFFFFRKKQDVNRKVLVMGDRSIGKTSLLHLFSSGYFLEVYEPTVFENYTVDFKVGRQLVQLSLWDAVAYQDYEACSGPCPLYQGVHVIMLCFSVDKPISLLNAENGWLDKIIQNFPQVKICLVALRCDLRGNIKTRAALERNGLKPVDYEQGLAAARRINASRYLECSARENGGVTEAFLQVAQVSINSKLTASIANVTIEDNLKEKQNQSACSCIIN